MHEKSVRRQKPQGQRDPLACRCSPGDFPPVEECGAPMY